MVRRGTKLRSFATQLIAVVVFVSSWGCRDRRPDPVFPGATTVSVREVRIVPAVGTAFAHDPKALVSQLGVRTASFLKEARPFNPLRLAEDRRRIAAFFETAGYFDVEVDPPEVHLDAQGAEIAWTVREGAAYSIVDTRLERAPQEYERDLTGMIPPFLTPSCARSRCVPIDLDAGRKVRYVMSEYLQRRGYGHARVWTRAFVDRARKAITWFYYVDAGPKTKVRRVLVEGNLKVPAEMVVARSGLHPGDRYDLEVRERRELDLLDTGAFASVNLGADTDIEIDSGLSPDSGGELADDQVDDDGSFLPRTLPDELDVTIRVVESPRVRIGIRASAEVTASDLDVVAGEELELRNVFGPQHHLVVDGRIGYRIPFTHERGNAGGLFGDGKIQYVRPSFLTRLLDARLTARYRNVLYRGFRLQEIAAGPGVRSTLTRHLFFDSDLFVRAGQAVEYGPFDAATRRELAIPDRDDARGLEWDNSLVWDGRDNPLEPTHGTFFAARTAFFPDGALGTNRALVLAPEARGYLPFGESLSIAARASAGWVALATAAGVPLGARLFGGGAFGMRGFARDALSPRALSCLPANGPLQPPACDSLAAGGLSLFEGSVEARILPPHAPLGAAAFVDVGGAGAHANAFEHGVSSAFGLGGRLRTWYVPIAVDIAYRFLDEGVLFDGKGLDPLLVFVRIGEAF